MEEEIELFRDRLLCLFSHVSSMPVRNKNNKTHVFWPPSSGWAWAFLRTESYIYNSPRHVESRSRDAHRDRRDPAAFDGIFADDARLHAGAARDAARDVSRRPLAEMFCIPIA